MNSSIVNIRGVHVHYRTDGSEDRPTVVFSNSLGTDLRVWDAVADRLRPDFRLVVYDKRGHGLSDCPDGPWSIRDHSRDLAGLLDALGIGRAIVCGLSVGGMIAQDLAAIRPECVEGLILCDTANRIGDPELWNARISAVTGQGLSSIADTVLERWFSSRFRSERVEFHKWRNMLLNTPADGYARTCGAIRDADLTEATARLRIPTLAMVGALDQATPPERVEAMAALIPGCRFRVIPDVGHLPCVEVPDTVADIIREFCREILLADV